MYSDIVIADLSEGNANVFYELGIRHALHKCSTILIIQEGYDIPFDLKQHVAVFIQRTSEEYRRPFME